jgi:hypothetical protein
MSAVPSPDQRFSFETDGYLVLESFLSPDHVARLRAALQRAIARRRELERRGTGHFARLGEEHRGSTRIFYLLADDPLFLDLVDYPPVMAYIRGLLNQSQPHSTPPTPSGRRERGRLPRAGTSTARTTASAT